MGGKDIAMADPPRDQLIPTPKARAHGLAEAPYPSGRP
jgi:hypothetical protein